MAKDQSNHYKFRDLKIFGSTEWLANNEKKYRLVFDESECTFIYCELSFFNKLFDEADWEVRINLKCVNDENGAEICNLSADRLIAKDENIVFVREGWGVKNPGNYWKKGVYRWEAWIDGIFVAEKLFYVIDLGVVSETVNPFFDITGIKLFEGPEQLIPKGERKYYSVFGSEETRYVWLELEMENLISEVPIWPCELTFLFHTHTGQLKGTIDKLLFVDTTSKTFECAIGWGNDLKGTWGLDAYSISVVFMDQVIVTIPFEVGLEFKDPLPAKALLKKESIVNVEEKESVENVLKELDALIGLDAIKRKVKEYTTYLNFLKIRK